MTQKQIREIARRSKQVCSTCGNGNILMVFADGYAMEDSGGSIGYIGHSGEIIRPILWVRTPSSAAVVRELLCLRDTYGTIIPWGT